MGAADVVPGVSGGTIALITHIYERLIRAVDNISINLIFQLLKPKRKEVWKKLDGTFLVVLASGMATSIFLVAGAIEWLLHTHPIPIWSFFFGLILASALVLKKSISTWNSLTFLALFLGIGIALGIGMLTPSSDSNNLIYLFFCGMLAIIAMILPGISGSFILILLGAYDTALKTVDQLKSFELEGFIVLGVMGLGGLVGLKLFSRLLRWLFSHHKNVVLALMMGFLFGSLYKVWPWKVANHALATDEEGRFPLSTVAVLPQFSDPSSQIVLAFVVFVFALMLIFILERLSKSHG